METRDTNEKNKKFEMMISGKVLSSRDNNMISII